MCDIIFFNLSVLLPVCLFVCARASGLQTPAAVNVYVNDKRVCFTCTRCDDNDKPVNGCLAAR